VDTAKGGSDRVGTVRESAPPAGTVTEGDTSGSGMAFNTARGFDMTGPRIGSTGLKGSTGVVVDGKTAFAAELMTISTTPVG
jgi:hypothetical protein